MMKRGASAASSCAGPGAKRRRGPRAYPTVWRQTSASSGPTPALHELPPLTEQHVPPEELQQPPAVDVHPPGVPMSGFLIMSLCANETLRSFI